MTNRQVVGLFFAAMFLLGAGRAAAQRETEMNALLVIDSESGAFNTDFQKYLSDNGARIIRAFPPRAFLGYVPAAMDAVLAKDYGTTVYREKIADLTQFGKYGESVLFAVNVWNKHFVEDPPEAPLVISSKVRQAKKGEAIVLSWNEVMKAGSYRLQISTEETFDDISLETVLEKNAYTTYPAFWTGGIYYWRAAGLLTLNTGEQREGGYSEPYSFVISKQAPADKAAALPAPVLPDSAKFKGRPLSWEKNKAFKYYRLQVSATPDFTSPILDVFTDRDSYEPAGLLERETAYYMRLMGSDGAGTGAWSGASEIKIEASGRKPGAEPEHRQ